MHAAIFFKHNVQFCNEFSKQTIKHLLKVFKATNFHLDANAQFIQTNAYSFCMASIMLMPKILWNPAAMMAIKFLEQKQVLSLM